MDVRFRPISTWPGERAKRRNRSPFKAKWSNTLVVLERELQKLRARNIVIEVDLQENQIRVDGWPRSGCYPKDPGVVISFDSTFGPLRYATDVFTNYEANIRAIALGLESLRQVDRYGITKRGEQYTGWKALPPGIALGPASGFDSPEAAAAYLAQQGAPLDHIGPAGWEILADPDKAKEAYRIAAKRLHPDGGGSHEEFVRLQGAWELVSA